MNICMIQIWRINTSNYIGRKWIHTDVWRNYSQITTKKCRKVKVLVTQLCSTLCDPMSLPGSSVHGILQARYWSELLFPPPGNLPGSGIEPRSPVLQADCLPSESPGKSEQLYNNELIMQYLVLSERNSLSHLCGCLLCWVYCEIVFSTILCPASHHEP